MNYYVEHFFDDVFAKDKPSKMNKYRYNYFNDLIEVSTQDIIPRKQDDDISSLINIFK